MFNQLNRKEEKMERRYELVCELNEKTLTLETDKLDVLIDDIDLILRDISCRGNMLIIKDKGEQKNGEEEILRYNEYAHNESSVHDASRTTIQW